MKKCKYAAAVLLAVVLFSGCSKKEPVPEVSSESPAEETQISVVETEEKKEEPVNLPNNVNYTPVVYTPKMTSFSTDAHAQYLKDPLKFTEFPGEKAEGSTTAVVASDVCELYPESAFSFAPDGKARIIDQNMKGTPIPFSTLLEITGEKLLNVEEKDSYTMGMFNFQKNWHWFYPVTYNGNSGYVFGSDLYGLNNDSERNRIAAETYRTNGALKEFYPYVGFNRLDNAVAEKLEKERLVFQGTNPLDYPYPDDMLCEYNSLRRGNVPVFVTTDLAAHTQHLVFDRILQHVEEYYFEPRLAKLTDDFISAVEASPSVSDETRAIAKDYFMVAKALLADAPTRIEPENHWDDVQYEPTSNNAVPTLSADAKKDYDSVMAATGEISKVLGTEEDFSQYRPRGHYTKNGVLEAYFRAQMWYGRIHFLITMNPKDKETDESTLKLAKVAAFIIETVKNNPQLYSDWEKLFTPITELIGLSDDLSIEDVMPVWKDQNVSSFKNWGDDKESVVKFMKACQERLRPPALSGNSLINGPAETDSDGNLKPPMGWRLFGQRFTYDSYVHEKVSPPRLMSRDLVRGLDVMKAFGSSYADHLLQSTDYPIMEGLKERLDWLENGFAEMGDDFWNLTYYNQVLYQVKSQASFEQGAGFYFTESPAWNIKSQIAAHGTWAELRHDTILYVKQVYAERAGDGDFDPTYRTKTLPRPTNYIEPNVPFWQSSKESVQNLRTILAKYNLLDEEADYSLSTLEETYTRAYTISLIEAGNKPISENDNEWIRNLSSKLTYAAMPYAKGEAVQDYDQLKMSCIADVFTNTDYGVCLEVGVGRPYRLYVPLNDAQGGKRIAIGYGFSYYEFYQPQNDRMTDETWKKITYNTSYKDMEKYLPFWEQNLVLPPSTK
ncbi:MAG: DUF3160 domain-containing protein [Treponema sp.]|nr:DUF3160 domain-containing protein [Treponema sp.]